MAASGAVQCVVLQGARVWRQVELCSVWYCKERVYGGKWSCAVCGIARSACRARSGTVQFVAHIGSQIWE